MEFIYTFLFLAQIVLTLGSQGPFLSWGINYELSKEARNSELTTEKILENLLAANHKLFLFIQPEFSVEDVTLHSQSLMKLVGENNLWVPAVSNPVSTVKSIANSQNRTSELIDASSAASGSFSDANVVVVDLPAKKEGQSYHEYEQKNVDYIIATIKKIGAEKALAMLTGGKNLQDCDKVGFSSQRRILETKADMDDDFGHVYNVSGEILLFIRGINISMTDTGSMVFNERLNVTDSSPSGSVANNTASISIDFPSTENISDINFNMEFKMMEGQWALATFNVTMSINDANFTEYAFTGKDMATPYGFSYTCSNLIFMSGDNKMIKITFTQFQVQPFGAEDGKFSRPYDCLGVLSIPIWMGLIVTLIFTGVLIVASSVVMSIKTMDKFDDPKGKTISVPTSE